MWQNEDNVPLQTGCSDHDTDPSVFVQMIFDRVALKLVLQVTLITVPYELLGMLVGESAIVTVPQSIIYKRQE